MFLNFINLTTLLLARTDSNFEVNFPNPSYIVCRVIQIILEQNYDKERTLLAKTIRVYAPYWLGIARCPPITFRILDKSAKRSMPKIAQFRTNKKNGSILEEVTDEEIYDGHTIVSALNFNMLALSVAIAHSGNEHFGPAKDLTSLGDMVISRFFC